MAGGGEVEGKAEAGKSFGEVFKFHASIAGVLGVEMPEMGC